MTTTTSTQQYFYPPNNLIIPLDIANIIIEKFDSNLDMRDKVDQA